MAQHDYDLANQAGAAFRADLNNALAAIVSQNSGATAPTTTFAYQFWADTTAGVLKQRNAANTAWNSILSLATGFPVGAAAAGANTDITSLADGATINGAKIGYRNVPQNSQSAAYTLVATDAGKHIYHPPSDVTARTWTIPANASVPFEIGTAITFDNDIGAGAITIAITTDTLVLVGAAGSTGSRTLASGGQATAIKVSATRWRISGTGLS